MRGNKRVRLVLGAALLAAAWLALLAAPGLMAAPDATVPAHSRQEARQ